MNRALLHGSPTLSRANGRQIDTHHAVLSRDLFLRRRLETTESVGYAHVGEARIPERRHQLCFQQSTGDSTSPEVDVPPRVLRQLDAKHDVGDPCPASGLQHASDLGDRVHLVGHEIQHAVGDDDVVALLSTGSAVASPSRTSTWASPHASAPRRVRSRIDSVMSTPMARPCGPT